MAEVARPGTLVAALACALLGCHHAPAGPGFPVPPPPPPDPVAPPPPIAKVTTVPPAVVSRFERPQKAKAEETREMLKEPPLVPPMRPKAELEAPKRSTLEPPTKPAPTDTLPDEIVMRLAETGRSGFVRCFKKAVEADPMTSSFKVRLHVELDADGSIAQATTDAIDPALSACLLRVASWVQFPASNRPVVVDLPLFFRGH